MAGVPLRRIRAVGARPGYRVVVTWERGSRTTVDLSALVSRGGVFSGLAEAEAFDAVRIGENSRVLEWPVPADEAGRPVVQIDADALFLMAEEQRSVALASGMGTILDGVRSVARAAGSGSKVGT